MPIKYDMRKIAEYVYKVAREKGVRRITEEFVVWETGVGYTTAHQIVKLLRFRGLINPITNEIENEIEDEKDEQ